MMDVTFEDDYISISYSGIDLLRNKFVYNHIEYNEISLITIKKGHSIRYWLIVLLLGFICICGPLSIVVGLFPDFKFNPNINGYIGLRTALTAYISLIFPFILGVILIYQALQKSKLLIIETNSIKKKFSLKGFEKKNKIIPLIDFLKNRDIPIKNEIA